jgi:hypothetical protein
MYTMEMTFIEAMATVANTTYIIPGIMHARAPSSAAGANEAKAPICPQLVSVS